MGASSFHVVFLKRGGNRGVDLGAEPILTLFIIETFPPPMADRPDSLSLYSPHVRPERSLTLNLPSPGCFGGTPESDSCRIRRKHTPCQKCLSQTPTCPAMSVGTDGCWGEWTWPLGSISKRGGLSPCPGGHQNSQPPSTQTGGLPAVAATTHTA